MYICVHIGDCQQNAGVTLCNRMTEISKVKSHPALRSQIFQGATLLLVPPCGCRNQWIPKFSKAPIRTSRPYNLHLKLMLSEQFFLAFWLYASANLQKISRIMLDPNTRLMLMNAQHHQQIFLLEGLVPSLPPAQPDTTAPCEDVKTHLRWTSVTSRCPDARHSGRC